MDALSLLIIIGPALLVIAMPYFLVYSFFRLGLKSDKPGIKRWTGSALFVVVVGLIFYGDILFSSVQLARLCHTKAGVYVYKRVMVPDEMWDFENHMIKEEGDNYISAHRLDSIDNPSFVVNSESSYEHWGVRTGRQYIYDYATGDRLFERFDYSIGAGWFAKSIPFATAPNRECSVEQTFRARYTLDDIPQELLTTVFTGDGWDNAKRYAIHPDDYIQQP